MPKMPKLNIVNKAKSMGTSIKDSTKNMAKNTVKGVKGLNPFKKQYKTTKNFVANFFKSPGIFYAEVFDLLRLSISQKLI